MSEDIGAKGPTFEWVVERGKIAEFAGAVLNPSEAHRGPDAIAPPTFPQTTSFWSRGTRRAADSTRQASRPQLSRPFDPRRVLHGEQEFEYLRPLRVGDELTGQTALKDYYEKDGKRGGVMHFAVYETTYTTPEGEIVAYARSTMIETSKAATS